MIQAKVPSGLITSLLRGRPSHRKEIMLGRLLEGLWVVLQLWYSWCYYSFSTVRDALQNISQSTHVSRYTIITLIFLIFSPVPAHSNHVRPNTTHRTMGSIDQPSIIALTPVAPNSKRGSSGFMVTPGSPPPMEEAEGSSSSYVTLSSALYSEEPLQHSDSGLRDVDPVSILPSDRVELPPVYSSLWSDYNNFCWQFIVEGIPLCIYFYIPEVYC